VSDERMRGAEPLGGNDQREKDMAESPASERETRAKQEEQPEHQGVDDGAVKVAPGTGGPDDVGDVEVDERDIHIPGRDVEP
jgi:hypothetical protein